MSEFLGDLKSFLRAGEGESVEFKERFNSDVIETAVALANTRGGMIFIGLSDSGKPCGTHFGTEALRDYVNRIATATEPSVVPSATRHNTPEGEVVVLQISEVPLKPVATRGRSYRRAGSTTTVMSAAEIAEMHMASTGQSMDGLIVARKSREDLDMEAVRRYMRRAAASGRRNFTDGDDPWLVLQKLGLVLSATEITRAAILLFGKNPQSPLTQAVVHAGLLREFIHIMDHRVIEGTVIEQVEETMGFLKKNLHVRFEISGAAVRKEIWDYPLVALREAVTNAICHRDYGNIADIQIKIFEDSLQIWSPGLLPAGVSVEEILSPTHTSRPRNKLVAQVFFDLGLIERYGGGIQRILAGCAEDGLPEPLLENFQGGFQILFRKPSQTPERVAMQSATGNTTLHDALHDALHDTLHDAPQVGRLLVAIHGNVSREWLMEKLNLKDRVNFRKNYLGPALDAQLIEMTLPEKPKSKNQLYRLTEKGKAIVQAQQ